MRHRFDKTSLTVTFVAASVLLAASPARSTEDRCQPRHSRTGWGESIGLSYSEDAEADLVTEAIELWEACPGYGTDFPFFEHGNVRLRTLEVVFSPKRGTNATCAYFRGNRIVLFTETIDSTGRLLACGDVARNLAHELGHVLGLDHVDRRHCPNQIMGMVDTSPRNHAKVSSAECAAAGAAWLTHSEYERAEDLGWIAADGFGPPRSEIDARLRVLDALAVGTAVVGSDQ